MNRSLLSLAIVRTNWDKYKKDHIENFIPLVGTLIHENRYSLIDSQTIPRISNDFRTRFGLSLPPHPLTVILRRMTKERYLKRSEGSWMPDFEKIGELNIDINSKKLERDYQSLLNEAKLFIEKETGEEVEEGIVEDGFLAYLRKHDLDILFAANKGSLLPEVKKSKKYQYLIGRFIEKSERESPEAFSKIVDITIGHALASTILYEDFSIYQGRLKDLNVYLDTPWLFDLLGIRGSAKAEMAVELLTIMKKQEVQCKAFDVNINELYTNLEMCSQDFANNRDPERASRTYKHCKMNDIAESDILLLLADLEGVLIKEYGIEADTVPEYFGNKEFQVDENELYDCISETYSKQRILRDSEESTSSKEAAVKSSNEDNAQGSTSQNFQQNGLNEEEERNNNTIVRDAQSLSGIYRMRQGRVPRTLRDSVGVFVTTNSTLALASRNFENKKSGAQQSIPSCITDEFLGTLIWLGMPDKAEHITRKKLIADCYALTQPDTALIEAYLKEVEKLKSQKRITDDQGLLLRTHQGAYKILNSKTYGDAREFTADMPYEILEQILKDMKDEAEKEVEMGLREKEVELKREREAKLEEQERHQKTKKELIEARNTGVQRENTFSSNLEKLAKVIVYTGLFVVSILLLWLTYAIQVGGGFKSKVLTDIVIIGLILLSIANLVFGFSIRSYAPRLVNKLSSYLKRRLLS